MRDANGLPKNPRLTIKEEGYPDRPLTVEFAEGTRDGDRTILLISCLEGFLSKYSSATRLATICRLSGVHCDPVLGKVVCYKEVKWPGRAL